MRWNCAGTRQLCISALSQLSRSPALTAQRIRVYSCIVSYVRHYAVLSDSPAFTTMPNGVLRAYTHTNQSLLIMYGANKMIDCHAVSNQSLQCANLQTFIFADGWEDSMFSLSMRLRYVAVVEFRIRLQKSNSTGWCSINHTNFLGQRIDRCGWRGLGGMRIR